MSSSQPGTPGTGWSISTQQEAAEVADNQTIVNGIRVYFRTQYGQTGSVFLPRDNYTPATVREAVTMQAATMDTVRTMSG